MAHDRTTIRISAGEESGDLGALASRILREAADTIEQFAEFELIEGRSSLFGSGDSPILTIVIKYDKLTPAQLEALQQMLGWARESGASIDITPPLDDQ